METFNKALHEFESKNYDRAYGLFEQAASNQSTDAMVNLAIMHMQGRGCTQSYEIAKTWFEKAALKGSTKAQHSLGIFFEKGMTGPVDEEKALAYYKQAADAGHVDSQFKTGMMFKQKGVIAEAMRYLITAAHNDNKQAQEIITYVSNSQLAQKKNEPFYVLNPEQQKALVEDMLDTKIRPTLAADGGGIELVNYIAGKNPQVWLNYQGTCSGCHLGSTSTAAMLLDNFETLIDKNVVLYLM
jgi:Fe-S cluster biogenesis protein NfuA